MSSRMDGPEGYRRILSVSLPLMVSMGTTSVIHFTDRLFLGNYDLNALAAALPAGITSFVFIALFMGTGAYVNVFVAQYTGARREAAVGSALWQGIWFGLGASVVLASLAFWAEDFFALAGHAPEVRRLEVTYFTVITLGGGLPVLASVLGCFYSGRGITTRVMLANLLGMVLNVPLDYALINGAWGLPAWGILGAGVASVVGSAVPVVVFALWIFTPANEARFGVLSRWRPDWGLFKRLMRFGLPNGFQFFVDIFGFAFFVYLVGRIGTVELAATNLVIAVDLLIFLPLVGFSIGVETLVGQAMGRGEPQGARLATANTLRLGLAYTALSGACLVIFPDQILSWFQPQHLTWAQYQPVAEVGLVLFRVVLVYLFADTLALIFAGALKGAGDSRFVMLTILSSSLLVLCLPVLLVVEWLEWGVVAAWSCLVGYLFLVALVLSLRFRGTAWQDHQVIEPETSA